MVSSQDFNPGRRLNNQAEYAGHQSDEAIAALRIVLQAYSSKNPELGYFLSEFATWAWDEKIVLNGFQILGAVMIRIVKVGRSWKPIKHLEEGSRRWRERNTLLLGLTFQRRCPTPRLTRLQFDPIGPAEVEASNDEIAQRKVEKKKILPKRAETIIAGAQRACDATARHICLLAMVDRSKL